jgi:phospholipid/cholesterol/gamma-HCH transport system substrate-binding protein
MRRRLVVLVLLAGVAASSLSACSGGGYKVMATFDDAGDLQSRGSVQVADVRVGSIGSIKLTKDFRARVTLHLERGVRIPKNSQALLRTTSLLGEKFIEIRPQGDPGAGPFLHNGDVLQNTGEAPELEFVADQAVTVLGAISSTDVAALIDTGAEAFGGRGPEIKALISDISQISATLASRTSDIQAIIDHLDSATQTLAAGKDDLSTLLTNLASATKVLVDNRQKAVDALAQLSRLAKVQNSILDRYRGDIDRQIKQVDAIVAVAAQQSAEVGNLFDWLAKFSVNVPKAIPNDFTQVFQWVVPANQDPRVGK